VTSCRRIVRDRAPPDKRILVMAAMTTTAAGQGLSAELTANR
jgi:hypothetical protein